MVRGPGNRRATTATRNTASESQVMAEDVDGKVRFGEDISQRAVTEQGAKDLARDYKSALLTRPLLAGFNFVMPVWGWVAIALFLAAMLKVSLLALHAVPFNSDEAVVALMARYILRGDRPIFFYGQSYMGSLDAWLVQLVLYLAYLLSLWLLGKTLFRERLAAVLAVFLGAVPVVVMTTYTTATLGGYGETLVFGNLILWLGYQIAYGRWESRYQVWLVFGLIAGLAFWTLALSLVYLIPVTMLILIRFWRGILRKKNLILGGIFGLAGFVLGSLPWWYANLMDSWEPMRVLLEPAMVKTTFQERLASFALLGIPTLIGIRFPWSGQLSPLPVTFLSIFFYAIIAGTLIQAWRRRKLPLFPGAGELLGSFAVCFVAIFLLSRNGIDATGRYLLPLSTLLVLITALGISVVWGQRRVLGIAMLVLAFSINGIETARAASSTGGFLTRFDTPTNFSEQSDRELMAFLYENGELRGYTNYWVSFRLAFLSDEELIYAARLPYKQDFSYLPVDDRIPYYSNLVDDSDRVAYITHLQPALDQILRSELQSLGVSFKAKQIGTYRVYFALSRPVRPEEIHWLK